MSGWPALDYEADKATIESLHLLAQLIGKLPVRLHPWINHGWHVALRMTPRGAITRPLPADGRHFTAELDFHSGQIRLACDTGQEEALPVDGAPVADVHRSLSDMLASMGLPAPLGGGPNEMPDPVPFAEDHRPRNGTRMPRDACTARFSAPIAHSTPSARSTGERLRPVTCSGEALTLP